MYAKVMPAMRLPRDLKGPFDYRIPDALLPAVTRGSVVIVPWRGKETDALVMAVTKSCDAPPDKVKDIAGLGSLFRLPEDLMRTIEWTAGYYFASPGTVLKAILPAAPRRKIIRDLDAAPGPADAPLLEGTGGGRVIRYASPEQKYEAVAAELRDALAANATSIVIVPHAADIAPTVEDLSRRFQDVAIAAHHGGLNAGQAWSSWQAICEGRTRVVVGTRQAVFAPLPRLGRIIVAESDSGDLKQYDQNPRFDARTVAVKRGELSGAEAVLMSHAPRTEEFALASSKGWRFLDTGVHEPEVTLIGLTGTRGKDERDPLPPTVMDAAADALRNAKKVLIFLNRRGEAPALICRDCGHVYRCPTCRIAYVVHASGLHCHRCGAEAEAPALCAGCGGPSLRRFGHGTASMERAIQAAFPEAAVVRKDAEQRETREGDIIIGTQLALHDIAETGRGGTFGLIVAADTDGLLAHGGFRTAEDAWRTVRILKDIAANDGARLALLAAEPDDPAIRALLAPCGEFMRNELLAREKTGYPPSATLIAIIAFGDSEDGAAASAKRLVQELAPLAGDGAGVHGPIRPSTPFRHGTWRSIVVVRARTLAAALADRLASLPEGFVIDRDPEYLS